MLCVGGQSFAFAMAAYKEALLATLLDAGWKRALASEFKKPYFNALCKTLAQLPADQVFPPRQHIFEALNFCPLDRVKVVIVGQGTPLSLSSLCFFLSLSIAGEC